MKNNIDDKLKILSDRIMKESSLETPSHDFTSSVMSQIKDLDISIVYKPPISKPVWLLLAVVFGGIVFLAWSGQFGDPEWFGMLNFNFGIWESISSGFTSGPFMYGLFCLALLLIIQVPIVKYFLDKRLEI